jgi:UDP-3-O-[3-hydroxymyristoyl] N-acetylglucosamine deacetylase
VSERSRRTLASPSEVLSGVGLHSGRPASVRLLPVASGTGVTLRDLDSGQEIPARVSIMVQTVEHLLSALAAMGVDDVLVETQGGEFPAADGSAAPFVRLIQAAGTAEHAGVLSPLRLGRPRLLQSDDGSSLLALPSPEFQATVVLDYPKHPWIGTLSADYDSRRDDYASEIAPARTYGFLGEIAWLQVRGLALGASRDNGIALREDGYDTTLRFDDELARHKLLDLIGDLSLIGRPLAARVIAVKPSHALNCRFARLLAEVTA